MVIKSERLISASEAKRLDLKAKCRYGVSTLILMENAGRQIADEAVDILKRRPGKIAVACGRGNNGGDGFVAARHLLSRGIKCDVFLVSGIKGIAGEAGENLRLLLKLGVKINSVGSTNIFSIKKKLKGYSVIVDALLGVGLNKQIRGEFKDLIDSINSSGAYILSVDIPSGLDATKGEVLGSSIKADRTLTFIARKKGMASSNGRNICGKVKIAGLGIPL